MTGEHAQTELEVVQILRRSWSKHYAGPFDPDWCHFLIVPNGEKTITGPDGRILVRDVVGPEGLIYAVEADHRGEDRDRPDLSQ